MIRNLYFLAIFFLSLQACKDKTVPTAVENSVVFYGEKISTDSATPVKEIFATLDNPQNLKEVEIEGGNMVRGVPAKLEGKVSEVCKVGGCWLRMTTDDGKELFISVKDHAFKLPADIVGKNVVAKGNAYQSVTTVEELRHYAKDEGQPQEKIAEIVAPKTEYKMDAVSVAIK